jgi:hypothetical protein
VFPAGTCGREVASKNKVLQRFYVPYKGNKYYFNIKKEKLYVNTHKSLEKVPQTL